MNHQPPVHTYSAHLLVHLAIVDGQPSVVGVVISSQSASSMCVANGRENYAELFSTHGSGTYAKAYERIKDCVRDTEEFRWCLPFIEARERASNALVEAIASQSVEA